MAVAGLKFVRKPNLHLRSPPFQCVRKVVPRSVAAVEAEALTNEQENKKAPAWKRLDSEELGIRNSMIGSTTKKVLNGLKKKGAYSYHSSFIFPEPGFIWEMKGRAFP